MIHQVFVQTVLQGGSAHHLLHHPHHHWCLVIEDVVVEQTDMVDVGEFLCDGVCTLCAVGKDGSVLEGLDEVQVVIHLTVLTTGDLRGHEHGEYLIGPEVVEPFQGHQTTEPQVGRLMGDQFHTGQLVFLCGIFLQEDLTVIKLNGSRMLHSTIGVVGQDHHAVFLERTGDAGIAFHPFHGLCGFIEHLVELGDLVEVGLQIERPHRPSVTDGCLLVEVTCHERVQVDRQLTAVVAGHRLPSRGRGQGRHEDGSQIRLTETGERRPRHIRLEDGVHIILVSVQGLVKGDKIQLHLVLSQLE